jgi:hypothetical protein
MYYKGDYPTSHTAVTMPWDSFAAATGAPSATTNFAAGDIQIYKDGGVTQRSSSAGITVTTSFDSNTGLQMIVIDLSDNTDAGFYAAGHEYDVAVADVTIDSQTVRFWVGSFSIERAGGVLALLKAGTAKVDVTKWLTGTIPAVTTTGVPLVDAKYLNGTLNTGRDIGASVLLSTGTGTGQLDFTSGVVKANLAQILGTALTETAGLLAGGFKKFFNIASPAATMDHGVLVDTVTTATTATNLTNAPTAGDLTATMKTSVTTAATAATPIAASVTGAVGSVTGNIGGNLLGTLTSTERNAISDAYIARNIAGGSSTGRINKQILALQRNKVEIVAGVGTVYEQDDTTTMWQFNVTTTAGNPISAISPTT